MRQFSCGAADRESGLSGRMAAQLEKWEGRSTHAALPKNKVTECLHLVDSLGPKS